MAEEVVQVQIFNPETGENVLLLLCEEDAQRAQNDPFFVQRLLTSHYEALEPPQPAGSSADQPGCSTDQQSSEAAVDVDDENSTNNLFIWPTQTVFLLLNEYEKRMEDFSAGAKRHASIWNEVALGMNKVDPSLKITGPKCQSKLNGLKRTYKQIIDHNNVSGNNRRSWNYFKRMDELFGKSGWAKPVATASEEGPSSSQKKDEDSPVAKKPRSEALMEKYLKELKRDREAREARRREEKEAALRELKDQKERHFKAKMDAFKTFMDAMMASKNDK